MLDDERAVKLEILNPRTGDIADIALRPSLIVPAPDLGP